MSDIPSCLSCGGLVVSITLVGCDVILSLLRPFTARSFGSKSVRAWYWSLSEASEQGPCPSGPSKVVLLSQSGHILMCIPLSDPCSHPCSMHVNALLLMLRIAQGQQAQARYPQTLPAHLATVLYSLSMDLLWCSLLFVLSHLFFGDQTRISLIWLTLGCWVWLHTNFSTW